MQTAKEFWWAFALGSITLISVVVAYAWNVVANQRRSISSQQKQLQEIETREAKLRITQQQLRNLTARLQSVREEERLKLSREVHDELGQVLTVIKIQLRDIEAGLKAGERISAQNLLRKLTSLTELTDGSITLVKEISSELRPIVLDNLGLKEAMEWEASRTEERAGIKCTVDFATDKVVLDREAQIAVFRIFQEALTNVLRHSEATAMRATVRTDPAAFKMEIKDNGKGMSDEAASDTNSLGLIGMKERALLLHGELTICSNSGEGTVVSLVIPYSDSGIKG